MTGGFTPVLTQYPNHDGTGRRLLHWDLGGHQLAPGSVFDIRLHATVAAGTPPGAYALDVLGGTNDPTHDVTCAGASAESYFERATHVFIASMALLKPVAGTRTVMLPVLAFSSYWKTLLSSSSRAVVRHSPPLR